MIYLGRKGTYASLRPVAFASLVSVDVFSRHGGFGCLSEALGPQMYA
jgi:hypothetical protein